MKKYKTIIIEDEERNASLIQNYIVKNFKSIEIVAVCVDVKSSIENIIKYEPDILLSDIELPDGTAFDVLSETKNQIKSLVFITAFDQYAIKAIKFSAIDYILKPIMQDELILAIKKCQLSLDGENSINRQIDVLIDANNNFDTNIAIPVGTNIEFVETSKIVYLKADGNYTFVFLEENKKFIVTKSIAYFEQLLNPRQFFRVHSSYMINKAQMDRISRLGGLTVIMKNGVEIDVAVRRAKAFLNFMGM